MKASSWPGVGARAASRVTSQEATTFHSGPKAGQNTSVADSKGVARQFCNTRSDQKEERAPQYASTTVVRRGRYSIAAPIGWWHGGHGVRFDRNACLTFYTEP